MRLLEVATLQHKEFDEVEEACDIPCRAGLPQSDRQPYIPPSIPQSGLAQYQMLSDERMRVPNKRRIKRAVLLLSWAQGLDDLSVQSKEADLVSVTEESYGFLLNLKRRSQNRASHIWIDSCCVDQSSSTQTMKPVSSMFRWFQNAAKYYACLEVAKTMDEPSMDDRCKSLWFSRARALQGLIASKEVRFLDMRWDSTMAVNFGGASECLGPLDHHFVLLGTLTLLEGEGINQTLRPMSQLDSIIGRLQTLPCTARPHRKPPNVDILERKTRLGVLWAGVRVSPDPKDTVYTLLGLSHAGSDPTIKPSYPVPMPFGKDVARVSLQAGSCIGSRWWWEWSEVRSLLVQGCTTGVLALQLLVIQRYAVTHGLTKTSKAVDSRNELWASAVSGPIPTSAAPLTLHQTRTVHLPDFVTNPSPLAFVWCSVIATMMIRLYAFRNRSDRYQKWFFLLGLLCWPIVSTTMGLNLLAGGICVMPWIVFGALLVSHAVHLTVWNLSPQRLAIVICHCNPEDQGHVHETVTSEVHNGDPGSGEIKL
ncbi:hypothetical protein LTR97_001085 [Elasticomyces elasticus]|uniref:Heterokaryon incompatibility domain-containing protein n=1 Tax=Elasticomyces elasticus TaxID=574655 RepID=A0AAN7WFN3_9PEZI|nr:hypothetical protein LTR97_001085 [Elasticomyces elasticus]